MVDLHFLPQFHRDVEDIWLAIARDDTAAADRMLLELYDRCLILERYPDAGPARPDIASGCRHLTAGTYLILYRYEEGSVTLVRALHGRRQITSELFDRV